MIDYTLVSTINTEIDESAIKRGLAAAEAKLGAIGLRVVSIEVVSPEESAETNQAFRGENKPTDIISLSTNPDKVGEQVIEESATGALNFELETSDPLKNTNPVIGQLILCYDVIAQNALGAGQPVERELEWVVEHGVLHLMGFHHEHDE